MKFLYANRIAPDGTPRYAASLLGLYGLLMSPKKDARLIGVKTLHFPSCLYSLETFLVIIFIQKDKEFFSYNEWHQNLLEQF